MDVELMMYKRYSRNVVWFLASSGLWPDTSPFVKKILSFVALFSVFIVMATVSNYCFQNVTNIMLLTKGMGLAVSYTSVFMKVTIFLLHHNDLVYLNNFVTTGYTRDLQNHDNRPDLLNNVRTFTVFLCIHITMVGLSILLYSISPIIILKKYGKYVLAFPAAFPFSYEAGGTVHWIIYGVEVVAGITLWIVTVGVDCGFGLYALQMCGELRILGKKFNNLRVAPNYKDNLKDCIQRHQVMINAKNKLEDLFGLISIWLALSSALVLCSLTFQVSEILKSSAGLVRAIPLCAYFLPKFLQIFMYAWYGNLITEESTACLNSMYNSHWPDNCNMRFKNDILIVLTQEPLSLKAKGCMNIQFDMFTNIVKTSVSYFFLLQTLNEDNE